MITYKEAAQTAIDLLGAAGMDGLKDESIYYRHLKLACARFLSETPAMIRKHVLALDGSLRYSLIGTRVGRLWSAEFEKDDVCSMVRVRQQSAFYRDFPSTNSTGGQRVTNICRDGTEGIRVWEPGVSDGTLTLFHAPVPLLVSRDSLPIGETVVSGTTTTISVTAPSRGKVANSSASSDMLKGIHVVFGASTTTAALRGGRFTVLSHNESATPAVYTTVETMPATPVSGDTFQFEDVIDLPDRFALACIDYAAGRVGLRIQGYDALCKQLLADFAGEFAVARSEGLDNDPAIEVEDGRGDDYNSMDIYAP